MINAVVGKLVPPPEASRLLWPYDEHFAFLRAVVVVNGLPLTRNQALVLKSLLELQAPSPPPVGSQLTGLGRCSATPTC